MGGWLLLVQELYVLKFLRNRSVLPSPLLIAVNFRNLTAANPPSDPFARLRERIEHPFAIFLTIFSRMLRFAWRYDFSSSRTRMFYRNSSTVFRYRRVVARLNVVFSF